MNHVVDSLSIEVNRRARLPKSDRLDLGVTEHGMSHHVPRLVMECTRTVGRVRGALHTVYSHGSVGWTTVSTERHSSTRANRTTVTRVSGSGPPRLRASLLIERQLFAQEEVLGYIPASR